MAATAEEAVRGRGFGVTETERTWMGPGKQSHPEGGAHSLRLLAHAPCGIHKLPRQQQRMLCQLGGPRQ
jgi:hypothetical protein